MEYGRHICGPGEVVPCGELSWEQAVFQKTCRPIMCSSGPQIAPTGEILRARLGYHSATILLPCDILNSRLYPTVFDGTVAGIGVTACACLANLQVSVLLRADQVPQDLELKSKVSHLVRMHAAVQTAENNGVGFCTGCLLLLSIREKVIICDSMGFLRQAGRLYTPDTVEEPLTNLSLQCRTSG
ncbi:hypothetical protein T440DRAFT_210803 [Plenodomus tracheiphilus IPT5]|uniref:Uncharacterized protein n=1 Tax=Plenodomus tracheiphilus IPT5 TaxID=1408161 RepID=A0A6A7AVE6_9PLEO|nr:hypothetical protein T440DRAFT_210803 [Plenodomus tracheiphilus IPT5]